MITQDDLKSILEYDPDTGVFKWLISVSRNVKAGDVAGWNGAGYIRISIKGKPYLAHRLAWLYFYGNIPESFIDHINMIPSDNRIQNLRLATNAQNMLNVSRVKKNKLGVRGVYYANHVKKYGAIAVFKGKHHFLGYYEKIESASAAYKDFAKAHHGEFYYGKD